MKLSKVLAELGYPLLAEHARIEMEKIYMRFAVMMALRKKRYDLLMEIFA